MDARLTCHFVPVRSRSIVLVRITVGLIFFTQGVLKYIDSNMGVNRFTKIGFSRPAFTAHFVGGCEMACAGHWTGRVAARSLPRIRSGDRIEHRRNCRQELTLH